MSGTPLPIRIYQVAANLIAPLAYRRVAAKLQVQGIARNRQKERLGHATAPRPEGDVLWLHAASVGESLSILRLISHMGETHPHLSFLVTSGTATSAQIVAKRLPPRTTHQFAPLDSASAVRRFLEHWRPRAAVFVESELWPQMISMTHQAGIPLALVNARISNNSARNWKRIPGTARHIMGFFDMIHCQDARTAAHLQDLGLSLAQVGANLKSLSGPLPYIAEDLDHLTALTADRPVWLASSTHPGEDEIVLDAHKTLLDQHPDALLILVPRHPERAIAINSLVANRDLTGAQRSTGAPLTNETQVYLADTLGETGLWYALSPITCVCGSFVPVGGHNPYEPAHAGSAILHGPQYVNFAKAYTDLDTGDAAREVSDAGTLAKAVDHLLGTPQALEDLQSKAQSFSSAQEDALDQITETLSNALSLR